MPGSGAFPLPCRVGGGGLIKHVDDTFNNVVDVGKVTAVFAVVKDLDRLARQYGFGELEQRHVGSTPRAIDGKETQAGGGQAVQVAIGVGHQLVGFFAGGIQAERVVHIVVHRERHGSVGAINAGAAGVD